MFFCNKCGKPLTALKISDDEPGMCQDCFNKAIDAIELLSEDPEYELTNEQIRMLQFQKINERGITHY